MGCCREQELSVGGRESHMMGFTHVTGRTGLSCCAKSALSLEDEKVPVFTQHTRGSLSNTVYSEFYFLGLDR